MFRVTIDHKGVTKLLGRYKKYQASLKDARWLWKGILGELRDYERAMFDNQGYGKWPFYTESFSSEEAAEKYMRWKDSKKPGTSLKLLVLSGKLKKSLTTKTSDSIAEVRPRSFIFGTKVKSKSGAPYPTYHNEGESPVAKRQFLSLEDQKLDRIFRKHVQLFIKRQKGDSF